MRRSLVLVFAFLTAVALAVPSRAAVRSPSWVRLRPDADEGLVATTSASGGRIFVAGMDAGSSTVVVVAYRYDGTLVWQARFEPPEGEATYVEGIAVSSDGREVFVTAPLLGPGAHEPMAVAAFDTSTGALEWSWLSTPVNAHPFDLATGPGIVTVVGHAGRGNGDWYVVALNPDTGAVLWTDRTGSPAGDASAGSVVVGEGRVYVSGRVDTRASSAARTVAYAAADGALVWRDTYGGAHDATIAGLSQDGTRLVVQAGWKVIEYGTAAGARVRVDHLVPEWNGMILDVTIDRRGSRIFFTGNTERLGGNGSDTVTAAYDVRTGRRLWFARFDGGGWDEGIDVAFVPSDPPQVVVTGGSEADGVIGWRTVAYGAAGGTQRWTAQYRGPLREEGFPRALAAAPDGGRVYVVGYTTARHLDEFATIAYLTS